MKQLQIVTAVCAFSLPVAQVNAEDQFLVDEGKANAEIAARLSAARPNVVIVMTDDQGYPAVSAHGNPVLQTPNLDSLHSESLRLTDYHVTPMCTPTCGNDK